MPSFTHAAFADFHLPQPKTSRQQFITNWALSQETHLDADGNAAGDTKQFDYADIGSGLARAFGFAAVGCWIVRIGLHVSAFPDTDDKFRHMAIRFYRLHNQPKSPHCISE